MPVPLSQFPEQSSHLSSMPSLTCVSTLAAPVRQVGDLKYPSGEPAWEVRFRPDGRQLAVCYGAPHPAVRIYGVDEKTNEWVVESVMEGIHERTIRSLDWLPITPYSMIATASFDGTVGVWEHKKDRWECTAQLEGHDNEVKCVRWNATGTLLATCGRDKTVWVWEAFLTPGADGDFECLAVLSGHEGDVKQIEFAASHDQWGDGNEILLSAAYDNTIKCWAEDDGDWYCALTIDGVHAGTVWSLALSPSATRLVSGSDDGSMAIYKCYTVTEKKEKFPDEGSAGNGLWKCVGKLPEAHDGSVYSISYAPASAGHGRIASVGADGALRIFREIPQHTPEQPLFDVDSVASVNAGEVNSVDWHPRNGSILAAAGDDGNVRLWKYTT